MRIAITPIALLALPALVHARSVSLMDFVPRVSDVSGKCENVYKQSIPNCDSTDFTQQQCSVKCVKGLDSLTYIIKEACGNDGLLDRNEKDNVLARFLKGDGPQGLCTNANSVLQSVRESSATPTSLETPTKHSSKSEQPTTSIVSSTKTASSTDVPTSLVVDTSSSPGPTESASSTSSISDTASITTATESSQIFEAPSMPASWPSTSASSKPTESAGHSGGGSPFDAEGNEFSAAVATSSSTVALLLAIVFAGLAAHW